MARWPEGTRFGGRYRHLILAAAGEDYRVGVAIEELAPGRQRSPAHYHGFKEEHVYVLEGRMAVRIGPARYPMQAGDYVCFPAGRRAGHCLINEGDAVCRYVIIGERKPNDVTVNTESGKLLVRALGPNALFDMAATRPDRDGEDSGTAGHGPSPVEGPTAYEQDARSRRYHRATSAGGPRGMARPFADARGT